MKNLSAKLGNKIRALLARRDKKLGMAKRIEIIGINELIKML